MKTMFVSVCLGLVALSSFAQSAEAKPEAFFFRDGDRAVILGDSITEGKTYSTLMESYVLSRFPKWNITFRNSGWGGDTMGLRQRGGIPKGFDRDLKPLNATAVTIDFGMNDARAGDKGYEAYLANARMLLDKFAEPGARVALITSSPEERYEKDQPAGSAYNRMLRKYSDGLQTVALEKNVLFVDQLAPMIEVIESGRKAGLLALTQAEVTPALGRLVPDAVHPQNPGGLIMAATILKGLHAPDLVSRVELDAVSGKFTAERAAVTEVKTGEGSLSFTRLDDSMPWPVSADSLSVAKIPGFTPFDDLSRYELKVTNLSAPKYQIAVDGKSIGTFTKEALAAGVNLSMQVMPAMPEMNTLLKAIYAKNDIFYLIWRKVNLEPAPAWIPQETVESARQAEIQKLGEKLVAAETALIPLRQPKPHQWTLTPTP